MSALATLRSLAMLMLVAALAACNAGHAEQRAAANESAKPAAVQPVVAETNKGRACNTDADCAIKDVGSCCGYRPQCLNKDTPTFPEHVKEQCAREGRVSTCGMLAISGCQCRAGKCENVLQSDESMSAPAAPAPLK